MDSLIHSAPSVGDVIKKMLMINPDLSAVQIIDFIKKSTLAQPQGIVAGMTAPAEVIDENQALGLANRTLLPQIGRRI